MTIDTEIMIRDSIRMNILPEILNGTANISFILDGANEQDYKNDIHVDGRRVCVLGCMNLSEDSTGEYIMIRPIAVKNSLTVNINIPENLSGKMLFIFSAETKKAEKQLPLNLTIKKLELLPNNDRYILRVTREDLSSENSVKQNNNQNINNSNTPVKNSNPDFKPQPQTKKSELNEKKIKEIYQESQKDYNAKSDEFSELVERYNLDKAIVEYYKDRDLVPIEKIFSDIEKLLGDAERQIHLFVNARQNKTVQIETEVKSNKGRN